MKIVFDIISKWDGSPCDYVWASDTSVSEGASYRQMSYHEFAKAHDFAPIETTVSFPKTEIFIVESCRKSLNMIKITAYLKNPHDKLYLSPMAQPLNIPKIEGLGFGVFYYPDASKPIKKGTMVSHYAGEAKSPSEGVLPNYLYNMSPSVDIDAEKQGNLSRFFAHLPTPIELKFFAMPKKIREQVARANLELQPYQHNGQGALAVVANQQIEAGEMMGFSYNIEYFLARGYLPIFYDKQGQPLDMSEVIFDKRRYMIFQMFNHQILLINELIQSGKVDIRKEWTVMATLIQSTIETANKSEEPYLEFENQLKRIFPSLERTYFERGLAEAFEQSGLRSNSMSLLTIQMIKELLFPFPEDIKITSNVELLFNARFKQFPKDHPRALSHTLHLNGPEHGVSQSARLSDNSMFSVGESSSAAPTAESTQKNDNQATL